MDRVNQRTIRYQSKRMAYPEVWGYIRRNQTANSFECNHCGQSFQTHEQLREHEVECIDDDSDKQK
jgi:transcriptional regulator NrdR family protein